MKYFEDGDLTVGIKPANRGTFSLEQITGEWHIVWGHIDGAERHTDYDDPNVLNVMVLTIQEIEPQQDKRKKISPTDDNIQIAFKFMKWGLVYQGYYDQDSIATKLRLVENSTPNLVEPDDEAVLTPALVRDDQDHPIIAFSTSALQLDVSQSQDALQNMEFVAKMTDGLGVYPLELSRNERLRLGFRHDDDGNFDVCHGSKPISSSSRSSRNHRESEWEAGARFTKAVSELKRLNEERIRVKEEIKSLRHRIYEDVEELGLSPPPSPAAKRRTPKSANRGSVPKRTDSGKSKPASAAKSTPRTKTPVTTPKRRKPGGRRKRRTYRAPKPVAKTNGQITPEEDGLQVESSGEEEDASEEDPPENDNDSAFSLGILNGNVHQANGYNSDDEAPEDPSKRRCDLCDRSVSKKNWNVHTATKMHQLRAEPGDHSSRKRTHASATSDSEDVDGRSSKRRSFGSPLGKLKRPSSTTLKRDAGTTVSAGRSV